MEKVKRLIFDFDNTLIMWKNEYLAIIKSILDEHNIDYDSSSLDAAIGETRTYGNIPMTVENVIKQAKSLCDLDITEEFVLEWFKRLGERAIALEDDIVETLEYLYEKYSLVILSNFNGEVQRMRSANAGIAHFFDGIYGSDEVIRKPHPDSYQRAMGSYKVEECIMIGDNIEEDIEGANSLGMKAIHIDRKGTNASDDYIIINKISDLKEIL